MRIIDPKVEVLSPLDGEQILEYIEECGRICYKSESAIKEGSAKTFVKNIIKRGHESVLEHFSFTVKFTCDRAIANEIIRHRIASYSQESTRYCNYSGEKFGKEITVIWPKGYKEISEQTINGYYLKPEQNKYLNWYQSCVEAEKRYFAMLEEGASPQEARAVLPNSLKTELIMTANLREWRHFFKLRCAPAAHPDMRIVAIDLLHQVKEKIPVVFDDIDF